MDAFLESKTLSQYKENDRPIFDFEISGADVALTEVIEQEIDTLAPMHSNPLLNKAYDQTKKKMYSDIHAIMMKEADRVRSLTETQIKKRNALLGGI
jgi:hypothetical protein